MLRSGNPRLKRVGEILQGQSYGTNSIEKKIKGRRVRNSEFKGYNSKIVSADKAETEEDLKLDQFYLGFVLQLIWL